ncbi:cell division protein ZipA [Rhodanobacter thiooxydans]|uniref:Cell division protein ZipA n=1 Tax=Rhodanobacter thiooxydans TaxID=416169 RepID=A0A154QG50_9GAMM|nr:cell division protein ZipA [Rhodanobacter thiooxydans]EIL99296.1 cell division protein ZipA [Rhodanobacter thiooxydans LCS2]KZC22780.1 cell division protein ZipA [Rhodanobacter thiooxydans]MCW0202117.1 cell division protein ZipA [Rhodanobacter thiooxydans]
MTLQPVLAFAWNPAVGIPMLIVGVVVLALIWLFGQPKKEQGRRRAMPESEPHAGERREPTLGEPGSEPVAGEPFIGETQPQQGELDVGLREELERLGATLSGERAKAPMSAAPKARSRQQPKLADHVASIIDALRAPSSGEPKVPNAPPAAEESPLPAPAPVAAPAAAAPPRSELGRRPPQLPVERIVTLFVVARDNGRFHGPDLVVAAEKAGLEFGDMGIYHRLVDGKRELGPIFSVANMLKPGNFDLARLDVLRTPGVSFFMTLPAPLPALDAWDAMLPTAQRLAELLDGQVLDEERNALGRQRIAHIRDQLRGWDRDHEGKEIIFGR